MTQLGEAVLDLSTDNSGLNKGLNQAESKIKKVGKQIAGLGKKMTVGMTLPILAVGAAVFAVGDKWEKAVNKIAIGTGATGEDLKELEASFATVFKQVPVDADTAAGAIADLNTMLGLTGEELENAAIAALNTGKIMGEDTTALIDSTTKAMSIFNIEGAEFELTLDKMFVTAQDTGIGMADLAKQIQTFGPIFKNAGFSFTETTALLGNFNKAGVDVARVMPAINANLRKLASGGSDELGKSIETTTKDLGKEQKALEATSKKHKRLGQQIEVQITKMAGFSDKTSDATRKAAGFKLDNMLTDFRALESTMGTQEATIFAYESKIGSLQTQMDAAAGKVVNLKEEFLKQVEAIKSTEDATERLALATELFGAEGAQRMITAILDGSFAIDDFTKKLNEAAGAANATAEATLTTADKMQLMKNRAMEAAAPLGIQLVGALETLMPFLEKLISFATMVMEKFGAMDPKLQAVILGVLGFVAAIGPLMMIIMPLITVFGLLLSPIGLIVIGIIGLIVVGVLLWKNWETIKTKAEEIWGSIIAFFKDTWDAIVGLFKDNWKLILGILFPAVGIGMLIAKNWDAIVGVIKSIWGRAVGVVRSAVNKIIGLINDVIRVWNNLSFGVGPFTVGFGDFKKTVGPWIFGTPDLPLIQPLAEGGITTGPQLAVVGDNPGGREAIIPLDKMGMGLTVNFNGPVFGMEDFNAKVRQATQEAQRRGLSVM